jgi:DNA-binding LytR/AlgR family response regulator
MWYITMNKLKMSSAEGAVSNPEGDCDSLVDDMAKRSCAALVIARETAEPTAGSTETLHGLQAFAKSQSLRVAVKIAGRILFINLGDVVSVQAKGRCVYLQRKASSYLLRESISDVAEKFETHGFIRIHRSVLVNTSFVEEIRPLFDGRIQSSSRRRKGIHRHPHLQEKSQIPRGILDWHGRVPWLT